MFFPHMVTARTQAYRIAIIPAVLFGLDSIISAGMTTADGQAAVDKEKINRLIEQAMKALDSGDNAAAVKYLEETAQRLPTVEAKTHIAIAINGLIYLNDTEGGARMHVQLARSSLQNSTG
jgi:outer membrane protein assembly factor BamD (BamD/ComL family)